MILLVDFIGSRVKCNSITFPMMASFLLSKHHVVDKFLSDHQPKWMHLSRIWIWPAALQLHPFTENGIWKAGRRMFSGMVPVGWRQGLKCWELRVCDRTQHAADEDVSEIPTPLWGRFLQGFWLGIWSPDPQYGFQCLSPLQTWEELSVQTPGLDLQLLEPLRKRNLHPWFPTGSIGVKLSLPLVQVALIWRW